MGKDQRALLEAGAGERLSDAEWDLNRKCWTDSTVKAVERLRSRTAQTWHEEVAKLESQVKATSEPFKEARDGLLKSGVLGRNDQESW